MRSLVSLLSLPEVAPAGPSSGLSPSTCGPPARAQGLAAPSDLGKAEPHRTRAQHFSFPARRARRPPCLSLPNAPPPESPHRSAGGPRRAHLVARPGRPTGPSTAPWRGDTLGARLAPGQRGSERAGRDGRGARGGWQGVGGAVPHLIPESSVTTQPGRPQDGAGGGPGEGGARGPLREPVKIASAAGNAPGAGGRRPGTGARAFPCPRPAAPPVGKTALQVEQPVVSHFSIPRTKPQTRLGSQASHLRSCSGSEESRSPFSGG